MNQKVLASLIVLIAIIVVLSGAVGYLVLSKKSAPSVSESPSSRKECFAGIVANDENGKPLLRASDDEIYNYFSSELGFCDESELRKPAYCENKGIFEFEARFLEIIYSPDKTKIGLTISPAFPYNDSVVAIFYPFRNTNKIHFLTKYYLSNAFTSFSPNGTYFVYRAGCIGGSCTIVVKNSETLEGVDLRIDYDCSLYGCKHAEFKRWISNNEIEYEIGGPDRREIKRFAF